MTINQLGQALNEMYSNAPKGNSVSMIHLFGVKFGDLILENSYSKKEIIRLSGISESYLAELNKGINLSKYVTPK